MLVKPSQASYKKTFYEVKIHTLGIQDSKYYSQWTRDCNEKMAFQVATKCAQKICSLNWISWKLFKIFEKYLTQLIVSVKLSRDPWWSS